MAKKINSRGQDLILLIHLLPPKPTNQRVRIWRKLQKVGAVAIKNSVYVLPATEETHEHFQWLKQEIESAGGEVSVFRADSVEGTTDDEIIAAFRKARDEEFAAVSAQFDGLTGAIREQSRGKHLSAGRLSAHEAELDKLHVELERIAANDFFNASLRASAFSAYERCQKVLRAAQGPTEKAALSQKKCGTPKVRPRYLNKKGPGNLHTICLKKTDSYQPKQTILRMIITTQETHSPVI